MTICEKIASYTAKNKSCTLIKYTMTFLYESNNGLFPSFYYTYYLPSTEFLKCQQCAKLKHAWGLLGVTVKHRKQCYKNIQAKTEKNQIEIRKQEKKKL